MTSATMVSTGRGEIKHPFPLPPNGLEDSCFSLDNLDVKYKLQPKFATLKRVFQFIDFWLPPTEE